MKETPTPTPRTDAENESHHGELVSWAYPRLLKHARQLERELAEAQRQNAELKKDKERLDWILNMRGENRKNIDEIMNKQKSEETQ